MIIECPECGRKNTITPPRNRNYIPSTQEITKIIVIDKDLGEG